MQIIRRLVFLTHPMAYQGFVGYAWAKPWIRLENKMKARWFAAMEALPPDAVVAIVSGYPKGPPAMEEVCDRATAILGPRCFNLREPDFLHPDFWNTRAQAAGTDYLHDLRDACLAQGARWNKEEMETLFHARICSAFLLDAIHERGMRLDPNVDSEAWGEEFEGCTTKYSLAFRHAMGLVKPVELVFDLCVPGAKFVMNPKKFERIDLSDDLRLFLFEPAGTASRSRPIALFISTRCTLVDPVRNVRLPVGLMDAEIRGKQGLRLWPRSQINQRKSYPLGYEEPTQELVRQDSKGLIISACAGVIYRWAKAPMYVFAPRGMKMTAFRRLLKQARSE